MQGDCRECLNIRQIHFITDEFGREICDNLMQTFRRAAPELFFDIHSAWRRHDVAALEFAAHKLKGSAAHLGANQVYRWANRVTHLARGGTLPPAAPMEEAIRELETSTRKTLQALEGYDFAHRRCGHCPY